MRRFSPPIFSQDLEGGVPANIGARWYFAGVLWISSQGYSLPPICIKGETYWGAGSKLENLNLFIPISSYVFNHSRVLMPNWLYKKIVILYSRPFRCCGHGRVVEIMRKIIIHTGGSVWCCVTKCGRTTRWGKLRKNGGRGRFLNVS